MKTERVVIEVEFFRDDTGGPQDLDAVWKNLTDELYRVRGVERVSIRERHVVDPCVIAASPGIYAYCESESAVCIVGPCKTEEEAMEQWFRRYGSRRVQVIKVETEGDVALAPQRKKACATKLQHVSEAPKWRTCTCKHCAMECDCEDA